MIQQRDIDKIVRDLGINLKIMADYQIKNGKTVEELDAAVSDCINYIYKKAIELEKTGMVSEQVNLFNLLVLAMMYSSCKSQQDVINTTARKRGVSTEIVIGELVADMEKEMRND